MTGRPDDSEIAKFLLPSQPVEHAFGVVRNRWPEHAPSRAELREQLMAIYDLPESLRESWRKIWQESP